MSDSVARWAKGGVLGKAWMDRPVGGSNGVNSVDFKDPTL